MVQNGRMDANKLGERDGERGLCLHAAVSEVPLIRACQRESATQQTDAMSAAPPISFRACSDTVHAINYSHETLFIKVPHET